MPALRFLSLSLTLFLPILPLCLTTLLPPLTSLTPDCFLSNRQKCIDICSAPPKYHHENNYDHSFCHRADHCSCSVPPSYFHEYHLCHYHRADQLHRLHICLSSFGCLRPGDNPPACENLSPKAPASTLCASRSVVLFRLSHRFSFWLGLVCVVPSADQDHSIVLSDRWWGAKQTPHI